MAARSYERGWRIVYRDGDWRYADTGGLCLGLRPCKRCGRKPTPEGHDACIGTLDGVTSACCGHGVERGYVVATC